MGQKCGSWNCISQHKPQMMGAGGEWSGCAHLGSWTDVLDDIIEMCGQLAFKLSVL